MTRPHPPEPLDPAERALAEALRAGTPSQGPSAAMDAAILAAAHAAANARQAAADTRPASVPAQAPAAASGRRRRHRSPAWLRGGALAASLVVAAGVAWQLRPDFAPVLPVAEAPAPAADAAAAPQPPATPAPVAAPEATPATARDTGAAVPPDARAASAVAATASKAAEAEAAAAHEAQAARALRAPAPAAAPAPDAPPPEEPPVLFDAPAAMSEAPPPPSPPAPPAPPAPRAAPLPQSAPAPLGALPARRAEGTARTRAASEAREDWLDQPLDDTPPASVVSPEVREAWLARIRELVAAERYDEARESYAEFRRRHPEAPVPDDLRMLLEGE